MVVSSSRSFGRGDGMRENLIGYLLDSLDEHERAEIDAARQNPESAVAIETELAHLRRALDPLKVDRQPMAAPAGLAERTIAAARQAAAKQPSLSPSRDAVTPVLRPRAWVDRLILAAAAVAAMVLLIPLLRESIDDSRANRAQRNLQKVGRALHGYADTERVFPTPPSEGPLSRAGLYAPTLVSAHRLKPDDGLLVYPGSKLDQVGNFRIPDRETVEQAVGSAEFDELIERMGGDYGYTLGYRNEAGVLQPIRDQRRAHHPLVADAPDASGEKSNNHPEGIHLILYEDGRVERIVIADDNLELLHRDDHLYRNHDGKIAAGTDEEDAVIGDSHHQP
jgi:hypothetical protein